MPLDHELEQIGLLRRQVIGGAAQAAANFASTDICAVSETASPSSVARRACGATE